MGTEHREWVLACDIDGTLLPMNDQKLSVSERGYEALTELCTTVQDQREASHTVHFGTDTGRTMASHKELESQVPAFAAAVPIMDFMVTSVGAESHIRKSSRLQRVTNWPSAPRWNRHAIQERMEGFAGLTLQPDIAQGAHKVSFDVAGETDAHHDAFVDAVAKHLGSLSGNAHIIFSNGQFLDILPKGVNKGSGLLHTIRELTRKKPFIVVAADSMNDLDLLRVANLAILPSNAQDSLRKWARKVLPAPKLYEARTPYAAGILEGIRRQGLADPY